MAAARLKKDRPRSRGRVVVVVIIGRGLRGFLMGGSLAAGGRSTDDEDDVNVRNGSFIYYSHLPPRPAGRCSTCEEGPQRSCEGAQRRGTSPPRRAAPVWHQSTSSESLPESVRSPWTPTGACSGLAFLYRIIRTPSFHRGLPSAANGFRRLMMEAREWGPKAEAPIGAVPQCHLPSLSEELWVEHPPPINGSNLIFQRSNLGDERRSGGIGRA